MNHFHHKKILIGITAGIAAYKILSLIRLFIKNGAEVNVIMTPDAKQFVTPLSLSTVSKNTVFSDFSAENGDWHNHVDLALWADLMLIAPCTANTLSKMANGGCDNLLLATYLSAKCPVYIAPAMDLDMYKHPTTVQNIATLIKNGNNIIPATNGELASGLVGEGRMAEPQEILDFLIQNEVQDLPFLNKNVMITAGPTYELIDPVRFIGNHSSGKMGFELAKEAAKQGANVLLVTGPTQETCIHKNIKRLDVITAKEMLEVCKANYSTQNIVIMSAAVADYSVKNPSKIKIKKKEDSLTLELVKNTDILKQLGETKEKQFLVGFALETNDEEENAILKLKNKNLDLIVLNSLNDKEAGFSKETNKVTLINKNLDKKKYETKSKKEVAKDILMYIESSL